MPLNIANPFENAERLRRIRTKVDKGEYNDRSLPGQSWFIDRDEILAYPRNDGDSRYPYGKNGFNFWAYSSGYMHSNEGIFSPFLRSAEGQEPRLCWYAVFPSSEGNEVIPLLAVPQSNDSAVRYTVFNQAFVTYLTEYNNILFSLRVYVTPSRETRFTLTANNLSNKVIDFYVSAYMNPFLLHDVNENGENRWFREVTVRENGESLPDFSVKCSENLSRTKQVYNFGVIRRKFSGDSGAELISNEETTSRYLYTGGSRSSLHHPSALYNATFGERVHTTAFTEVGACGDLIRIRLQDSSTARIDSAFTYKIHCEKEDAVNALLSSPIDASIFDRELSELFQTEIQRNSALNLKFTGGNAGALSAGQFNAFFEHLKKQVEFCATIKGYIQLSSGSLIGIRDIFQALEAYMLWQPGEAKAKMLEALSFTDPSGRCPRQYALPIHKGAPPAMDLRPFIDQGVWVISTIINYLKFTGDFGFLNEVCGYHEIVDEQKRLVRLSEEKDTVLDHMVRILNWLIDKTDPKTDCIRVLFGDWNDALDGLGVSRDPEKTYGSGVSVMAAAQVWQNLNEMMQLLSKLNADKYSEIINEYSERAEYLATGLKKYGIVYNEEGRARIVHGWGDERSYYVGSFKDPDGQSRRSLTSNAFWVLSGLYDRDTGLHDLIKKDILSLDSKYGLKTFEPHFEPDAKGVGRIPKLPAGTAENGAAYIHASTFGIMALFRMGDAKEAWAQLVKSIPVTHKSVSVSPYVMPNSYGENASKNIDGQSMLDWQTGSSNVVLKLLMRFVAGVRPEYDGVWIQPAAYCPFDGFEAQIKVKGTLLNINYRKTGKGERTFTVNGEAAKGKFNERMKLSRLWICSENLKDTMDIVIED